MKLVIRGVVQGVGFRPAVVRTARKMGLNGHVINHGSNVEIVIDGDAGAFIKELRNELPPLARMESVETYPYDVEDDGFAIRESSSGALGSPLPPDTGICPSCRQELLTKGDRRFMYPFTNCTDCGARYSVIRSLPFDRERTAMSEFPMCKECSEEYRDPGNRRFHAQTISCPSCGPRYVCIDSEGKTVGSIPEFADVVRKGGVGVMKGWGGMHLIFDARLVRRFRDWYGRRRKPLAVMYPDMDTLTRHLAPGDTETELLRSRESPIVLVRKRKNAPEWVEELSPGIDTVGAMLPYSAAQVVLFEYLPGGPMIFTSANPPGEPMAVSDRDALSLGADAYLLHNRSIVARVDDSVVKVVAGTPQFIRRSRGYVPGILNIPSPRGTLAFGGEENLTVALGLGEKTVLSQHIGDVAGFGVEEFARDAMDHLVNLYFGGKPRLIVRDLHPGYATTRLAENMGEEIGVEIIPVQHHHAHAASLLAEHGLEEMAVLTLDGTGYGEDGTAWGGEVLHVDGEGYRRIGHLAPFPLPGGEMAVKEPGRILLGMLNAAGEDTGGLELSGKDVLTKLIPGAPLSTSFGRMLDALSAVAGVCTERSYRGEPAMLLERVLNAGDGADPAEVGTKDGVVDAPGAVASAYLLMRTGVSAPVATASAVKGVLGEMVLTALDASGNVGISGGVAYSVPIVRWFAKMVRERGGKPFVHSKVPPGDGGVSVGQAFLAALYLNEKT